jgi:putative hydrolase of the HAD superfamily
MQCTRENLLPRDGVIETLQLLRATGHKIGLISDCSWETPAAFAQTEMAPLMDACVFSCVEKLKKPDDRLYRLACERLAVRADRCLYVADGNRNELAGALAAGMDAALICAPHEEAIVLQRPEAAAWTGPRVASIPEVLRLLAQTPLPQTAWRSSESVAQHI